MLRDALKSAKRTDEQRTAVSLAIDRLNQGRVDAALLILEGLEEGELEDDDE